MGNNVHQEELGLRVDGRWVAMDYIKPNMEMWVMENFMPK
jgi:hypothetical protein